VALAMIGMRFGRMIAHDSAFRLAFNGSQKLVLLAVGLLAILLVLLVHELGHLLGGHLVGFRAFLLIIGPFRFERSAAGWSMRLNTSLALSGGLAGSAPTDTRDLRRRTAIMVAAGPLASILLALIAGFGAYSFALTSTIATAPFLNALTFFTLITIAVMSAGIALVTLIPGRTSGFLTDGARLLRLLRGGPVAARDSALQAIGGSSLSGIRPRDWDPSLLHDACALEDGSAFAFNALQLMQIHTADRGDINESLLRLRALLTMMDRIPKSQVAGIHLDAARQFALAGSLDEARVQRNQAVGPVMFAPHLKPFADAAILAAEGREAESLTLLGTIPPMLAQSFDRGGSIWLMDSLESLQARVSVARTVPSA
jgi:Peptidase family M50